MLPSVYGIRARICAIEHLAIRPPEVLQPFFYVYGAFGWYWFTFSAVGFGFVNHMPELTGGHDSCALPVREGGNLSIGRNNGHVSFER